jgi:hypothetical protein
VNDILRVPLHVLPEDSGCVIDCDSCAVRGDACADCVVSVMLGGPPPDVVADEHKALGVLADFGLVPPLLMTPPPGPGVPGSAPGPGVPPATGGRA